MPDDPARESLWASRTGKIIWNFVRALAYSRVSSPSHTLTRTLTRTHLGMEMLGEEKEGLASTRRQRRREAAAALMRRKGNALLREWPTRVYGARSGRKKRVHARRRRRRRMRRMRRKRLE